MTPREGWRGWDEYAPFYDWENAQTLGRQDLPFWRDFAGRVKGPVLELGCGTGRISVPLARAGVSIVGIDRSARMLAYAARRARRRRSSSAADVGRRLMLIRSDIRALPFDDGVFALVMAPYGILQSILKDRDLAATFASVRRVLRTGGAFGIDIVPDVPNWQEYTNKVRMRGKAKDGTRLTLIESVRHDRSRHFTVFEQTFRKSRGRRTTEHRFDLTFRTLPMRLMTSRLERAGFRIDAVLGDYRGAAWDERADTWIILARRT